MIMKKKVLAASVAAVLGGVGAANATLSVTEAGVGHALITPYFTTQGGYATILSITNTDTTYGKAVKVRFRGGVDSDDIFDFQVFLSPNDVWNATVTQGADGRSVLATSDKSCTLPSSVNQSFVTSRLVSYTDANGNAHTPAAQTREGYVEIFNMGDIPQFLSNGAAGGAWVNGAGPYTAAGSAARSDYTATTNVNPLWTATKHVNAVAPCTSATLLGIEAVGGSITAPAVTQTTSAGVASNVTLGAATNAYTTNQQLIAPTSGLMGNWTIINVPATRTYSGGMQAIRAATTAALEQTMVVYSGQVGAARVATHNSAQNINTATLTSNVFPALRLTSDGVLLNQTQTGVTTADYDFPDMSTPYEAVPGATAGATTQATPANHVVSLSNSILRAGVMNEFTSDSTITAGTDWVLSMPTRRYHVAGRGANYGAAADTKGYPTAESIDGIGGGVTAPFVAADVTFATNGRSACIATGAAPAYYDREETAATGGAGAIISPGLPTQAYSLCGEVNVLSWNNTATTSSVLAAQVNTANSSAGNVVSGWANARMTSTANTSGLPILGDAFIKASNPAASAGVSGNYGAAFKHRFR